MISGDKFPLPPYGRRMYELAKKIFPIHRCLTGEGVRQTLAILSDYIAEVDGVGFDIKNVPTGTQVFDWTVPKEWLVREAYIEDENGEHIIDVKDNNLHVIGYSMPVDRWVDLQELKKYIYTQDDQPDVIPYVTSYYKERYGFCMSKKQKDSLVDGKYHMYIDSELKDGNLTYGELIIPGETDEEIFFSTYDCHPSMANNECSGPALMAELIRYVKQMKKRKYTYRFIIIPETIGSITYLSTEDHLAYLKEHVIAGFVLTCVGDNRDFSYVESKYADTLADRVLKCVLTQYTDDNYSEYSYLQRGSDERQYGAPGVDLPVVCFCRSKYDEFKEYHTSADDMSFVSPEGFQGSFNVCTRVIDTLECNSKYKMTVYCEPQLGKRGLYPTISQKGTYDKVQAMMDVIAYADGKNDLIDLCNRIHQDTNVVVEIINQLLRENIMEEVE